MYLLLNNFMKSIFYYLFTLKRKKRFYIVFKNKPITGNNDCFPTHCHQIQLKIFIVQVRIHRNRMFLNRNYLQEQC